MITKDPVLPKETAIADIINFVAKWDEKTKTEDEILEGYPDMIDALMSGDLTIDENLKAEYRLTTPILNDKQEVAYELIKFRTRIKPTDLAEITKGMNISKQQHLYLLKCMSYITGLPVPTCDKLTKKDYRVLDQISTIFL